jgi:uncharacterized membrane protein (UPF0182 family)
MQDMGSSDEAPRKEKGTQPDPLHRLLHGGNRGVRITLLVIAGLGVLVALWAAISYYWTNYLWYQEMGHTNVFWTPFLGRLLVGLFFAVIFFALFYGNAWLARRLSPRFRAVDDGQRGNVIEMIMRRRWSGRLVLAVSILVALIVGVAYGGRWQQVLVYLNQQPFGQTDPLFGKDASFFVYTLPIWNMLLHFVGVALLFTAIFTAITYATEGAVTPSRRNRVSLAPRTWIHLSVLLALGALAKAGDFALQRWELVYSQRGVVSGANYTDVHTALPVLSVLAIVTIVAAALFLVNLFFRGWKIPVAAVVLVFLVWAVGGKLVPTIVQRFSVKPNEYVKDSEYIADNIQTTRWAFGLDSTTRVSLEAASDLTAAGINSNPGTIDNIRVWDPGTALTAYRQIQSLRSYYTINDVDVDRYVLDGKFRQVLIGARELNQEQVGAMSWVNGHLSFTHGYGFVLSPVNQAASNGQPVLLVSDIPPITSTDLKITRPEIYYGETGTGFVIVKTKTAEFDYPKGDENVTTTYQGEGGIPTGGFWRKLAFTFRLSSKNILFSSSLTDESRIMFRRTLRERVQALAPFLSYDYDPYLVVREDGSLVWMWDAYATTSQFPYSQPWSDPGNPNVNLIPTGTNYIRNSVKVVIDAYNGKVTFYQMDGKDSIANTWGKVYEGLFTSADQMPADLRAHIRYPENLYTVQADMLAKYHMTDPKIFYSLEDVWRLPTKLEGGVEAPMVPYYEVLTLPGETEPESALLLPFTPKNTSNMAALLVARQDGDKYGELILVEFPKNKLVDGPAQIEAKISNDPDISSKLTLWDQAGSRVIRGSLLVVPMGQSVVYFEPIYLQADQANTIPELKQVIVAYGSRVVMKPTVGEALVAVFGEGAGTTTSTTDAGATTTTTVGGTAGTDTASLIAQANQLYLGALEAQKAGDWAGYGRLIEQLGSVLRQLSEAR